MQKHLDIAHAARISNPSDQFSSAELNSSDLQLSSSSINSDGDEEEYFDAGSEDSLVLSLPDSFDQMIGIQRGLHKDNKLKTMSAPKKANKIISTTDANVGVTSTEIVQSLLRGLTISEALYAGTKFKPEESLSAQELLNLRMCEAVLPLRRSLEQTRSTLEMVRKELSVALSAVESQGQELQRYRTLSDIETRQLVIECESLKSSNADLTRDLSLERDLRLTLADKAQRFDAAISEMEFYREEVIALRKLMTDQSEMTRSMQTEDRVLRARLTETERERELFRADKTFLQREVDSSCTSLDACRRKCEELEMAVRHAEARATDLSRQITTLRTADFDFAESANRLELERLRELIIKETEAMRLSAEEAMSRENRTLRETIFTLQTELSVLRREHSTLVTQSDRTAIDFASKIQKKEFEINELRTSLKIKAFETTSLGILFEERAVTLRRRDTEVCRLTEEIAILRAALTKADLQIPLTALSYDDEYLTDVEPLQNSAFTMNEVDRTLRGELERLKSMQVEVTELQRIAVEEENNSRHDLSPHTKTSPQKSLVEDQLSSNKSTSQSRSRSPSNSTFSHVEEPLMIIEDADNEYDEEYVDADADADGVYSQDGFEDVDCDGLAGNIPDSNASSSHLSPQRNLVHLDEPSTISSASATASLSLNDSYSKKRWHERLPL